MNLVHHTVASGAGFWKECHDYVMTSGGRLTTLAPHVLKQTNPTRYEPMTQPRKVGVLVGSLRKESFTRKMTNAFMEVAPKTLSFQMIEIGGLPLYNEDMDGDNAPEAWKALRGSITAIEAILFATPEYNRSIPGGLKNAIDIASRPSRKGALTGKPGMVMSVSPGALSAFGAHHHLRQCMVFLDMPTLQQPEMYLGGVAKMFDESGKLINDSTREFLAKGAQAFCDWINLVRPVSP